jgi:hypothetical protein
MYILKIGLPFASWLQTNVSEQKEEKKISQGLKYQQMVEVLYVVIYCVNYRFIKNFNYNKNFNN